jgi:hypothetical protein
MCLYHKEQYYTKKKTIKIEKILVSVFKYIYTIFVPQIWNVCKARDNERFKPHSQNFSHTLPLQRHIRYSFSWVAYTKTVALNKTRAAVKTRALRSN